MSDRSKRLADLSPAEKRALLTKLLEHKPSELMPILDRLGIRVTDLQTEAVLDPTIDPQGVPAESVGEPMHILLTGATGFLGAFLLRALLQQTSARLYCLVLARDAGEGQQKIQRTLESYGLWQEGNGARIVPVVGDLSRPLLGQSAGQFHTLAHTIDTIYHNGAFVNWIYPYQRLKPTNVLGTQEVLKLASQAKVKPVHFISTLAVFPLLASAATNIVREPDTLDHGSMLYGGYAQSKWVAEKLITVARSRGIPVCIYRPSLIAGDSHTGAWNTEDILCRMMKSVIELGGAPDEEANLNLAPVDYVSRAVVYLSLQRESLGKVFHVANSRTVSWKELVTWLRSLGYPVQLLPYDTWRARLVDLGRLRDSAAFSLTPLLALRLSGQAPGMLRSMPRFDCQNTLAGLAGTSIVCPPIDRRMFETYFSYFIRRGFLNAPPPAEGARPSGLLG